MLFSRFFRRTEKAAARNESRPPAPRETAQPRDPRDFMVADPEPAMDSDPGLFAEMEQILGENAEVLRVPCRALLAVLPEEHRGSAYRADAIPHDVFIELDRTELLGQLRSGRVVYPLDTLAAMLPPGWVRPDADTLVELSLPDVVDAVPADLLRGADQLDEETIEVAQMRDYFRPQREEPEPEPVAAGVPSTPSPEPPAAKAAPSLAAVAGTAARPARPKPTPPPWAWDGVETGRDASAHAIDLNRARIEDVECLPGLGRVRAERILAWREQHGPFQSIYALADIPGVGRRLFHRCTGLNTAVTKRKDRHAVLNSLLGLPEDARPGLGSLVEHIAASLDLAGCVLADSEGVILAACPDDDQRAPRLAALTPKFFRRARRYLSQLAPEGSGILLLPGAENPLVLARAGSYYTCASLKPEAAWQETVGMLTRIGVELEWLLGPRLVVHKPEPAEQG